MTGSDRHKKVKIKVRATRKGDLEVSFGGDLDLDRLVDKAAVGIGEALSSLSDETPKPNVAMRSRGKRVVPVQVGSRGIPDLTEEERAKREPPLTRMPRKEGPAVCPVCKVRMRDCPDHGRHAGREDITP